MFVVFQWKDYTKHLFTGKKDNDPCTCITCKTCGDLSICRATSSSLSIYPCTYNKCCYIVIWCLGTKELVCETDWS